MKSLFKRKIISAIATASVLLVTFAIPVFAGYDMVNYDVVIGRFNGSANTNQQTVAESEPFPILKIDSVGGGYKLDVQPDAGILKGDWTHLVTTGFNGFLERAPVGKGGKLSLRFSNALTTTVNVRTHGAWSSN